MNNPYRIHSTICVYLFQLLMIPTISYNTSPPPPIFHSVIVSRVASSVYYGYFKDSQTFFMIDCTTIAVKMITDFLYIQYIVTNYAAIFGILDIISDIIFLIFVIIPKNTRIILCDKISEYCGCRFNYESLENNEQNTQKNQVEQEIYLRYSREYDDVKRHFVYSTINTSPSSYSPPPERSSGSTRAPQPQQPPQPPQPHYSNHQQPRQIHPFKNNFYRSNTPNTTAANPIHTTKPSELENLYTQKTPNTMYVNFDEYDNGEASYANTLVSPYFDRNATPITLISTLCENGNSHELWFIIGNILHLISQIMIYINIINTCKSYTSSQSSNMTTLHPIQQFLC